jgi:hypothetical protein
MKKLAITLLSVAAATTMYGQGNFNFNNVSSAALITVSSNNAGSAEGLTGQFVGTGYSAAFFYGPAGSTAYSQLTYFGNSNTTFFGTGAADADQSGGAGLFDGGNVVLPAGITGNEVIGVAVWWSGGGAAGVATSYAQAVTDGYNTGLSPLLTIPLATGTLFPVALDGLASFQVGVVPEPTTLALCGLGAASLLLFRRKK